MKRIINNPVFRPPGEADSLILQVDQGCPSRCTFCGMYRRVPYRRLSLEEVDVNGNRALVWKFDTTLEVDGEPTRFSYTFAYFRRGTQNATLSIWTLKDFYERRHDEIDGIVGSFDW